MSRDEDGRPSEAGTARKRLSPFDWSERVFEDAPAVIAVHQGPEHVFVYANRAFGESSDGRPLIGLRYAEAFPEFVAQGYLTVFDGVYGTGEPFIARGARADTPRTVDGPAEERYWNLTFQPTRDGAGAVDGLISFAFEVTDHVFAARRAETASRRYDDLVEALGVVVWSVRPDDWKPMWVGGQIEAVLRVSAAEAMQPATWQASVHPNDRARVVAARNGLAATGDRYEVEYRRPDDEGPPCWLAESGHLVGEHGGSPGVVWGLTQDVTERVLGRLEQQRLQEQVLHVQKLESLGVLAGGIAHDFNNLLTSVLGHAGLAAALLPPDSPVRESVAQITEASKRAAELCKQMLAYSGRGRFVLEPRDLGQLVEQTVALLHLAISKRAALVLDLAPGLPLVEMDATQMRQVIMNLVINASDAIDETGEIRVSTGRVVVDRAWLASNPAHDHLAEGEYVSFQVSDDGCGMSAETRARIFDPFFTTKFTGRGLGLAAVLGIVRGHKGSIVVSSEPGHGTTFRLLFPASGRAAVIAGPAAVAVGAWRGHGTVLVVDDEAGVRSTVAQMLAACGLDAVVASDGVEALETLRASPDRFALVVLDLTMPRMDGRQTFAELYRRWPALRVVLMSGFDAEEVANHFEGAGPTAFLQKPFTVAALASTLRGLLG